jgi:hypothetical protein
MTKLSHEGACTSPLTALSTIPQATQVKHGALVPLFTYTSTFSMRNTATKIHTTLKSISNSTFFTFKPIKGHERGI